MPRNKRINPFLWDGSDLGFYTQDIIISKEYDGFLLLEISGWQQWCQYKKGNQSLMRIIDQIKPLFGLLSRGSHLIKISRELYTIFPAYLNKLKEPVPHFPISNLFTSGGINPLSGEYSSLNDEIRKILVFREVCCISGNFMTKISVYREENGEIKVTSEFEKTIKNHTQFILSNAMRNRWFKTDSLKEICQILFPVSKFETERITQLLTLKMEINQIILSIDRTYIWFSSLIFERLQKYLEL